MWITFDIEVKGALSLNECSLNPIKVEVSGSFSETVYGWKLLLKSDFILFFYANHLCTRDKHEMRTFLSQLIFLSMLYKKYSKDILISKFVIGTMKGVIVRFALVRFWNHSHDYFLNCTPLSPIAITSVY